MDNFVYGSIGGLFGTFLSHPIDTIKTRLQTNQVYNIKDAIKMGKLYNGLKAPLIGIPFEKSIVFGFYHLSKENNINNFWSGIIGGLMSTIIVTPVEYFKINLQNKKSIDIFKLNIKDVYKGIIPTIFRETPGFGIYFSVYNYLNNNYNRDQKFIKNFCYGGLSGLSAWIFIYPADLIKSKIQDTSNNKNMSTIIKNIYKNNGFFGFYNGFKYAAMRAIPLHAGVFFGYEISHHLIKNDYTL
jgi:solute carrier family 25 carnitine/acylcarnitine transporter 20/29